MILADGVAGADTVAPETDAPEHPYPATAVLNASLRQQDDSSRIQYQAADSSGTSQPGNTNTAG